MNSQMYNDPETAATFEHTTLAAIFADRESAHDAIGRLHDDGFHDTWLGLIRGDDAGYGAAGSGAYGDGTVGSASAVETRVESENWFARVFGEGDESLHDALVRRGVTELDAQSAGTAGPFAPNSAILTVDGGNDPAAAVDIMTAHGGRVVTRGFGAGNVPTAGDTYAVNDNTSAARDARIGAPAVSGAYDVGTEAGITNSVPTAVTSGRPPLSDDAAISTASDDTKRIQLREERLRIDKERRALGEVAIGKDVVTEKHDIDVPLIREEFFIERRPVGATAAATGVAPIGETEIVRIPLSEEQLTVSKTEVVTEEVVIGKRQVTEMGHVSETTRREELTVDDAGTTDGARTGVLSDTRI